MTVKQVKDTWKSLAAYVYFLICIFDFIVMPAYTTYLNNQFVKETVAVLEPDNRTYLLDIIDRVSVKKWDSITVSTTGGMMFHLTFCIILGGSAITNRTWTLNSSGVSSSPIKGKDE